MLVCCEEVIGSSSGVFVTEKCTDLFHGKSNVGLSCVCPCGRGKLALNYICRKTGALLRVVVYCWHATLAVGLSLTTCLTVHV